MYNIINLIRETFLIFKNYKLLSYILDKFMLFILITKNIVANIDVNNIITIVQISKSKNNFQKQ